MVFWVGKMGVVLGMFLGFDLEFWFEKKGFEATREIH